MWSGPDQPHYLNASAINNSTYDQLLFIASNELDWPQQSGSTGFVEVAHKDCPGMLKNKLRCAAHVHWPSDHSELSCIPEHPAAVMKAPLTASTSACAPATGATTATSRTLA